MTELTNKALGLAEIGIPVFPLRSNKRPCHEGGFKAASTDEATICRAFADPLAALIGVPTGAASGFDTLDLDPRSGADEWLRENESRIPVTKRISTRSGGVHFRFKHTPGMTNSASRIAPGVDVRGDGGYVVAWDMHGFHSSGDTWAEWPAWLIIDALRQINPNTPVPNAEDLAPPDAETLILLLEGMPNPADTTRDDYTAVNLAVQGCIRSLEALGKLDDATPIYDAAAEWSSRWDSANASDFEAERARWDDDWSKRDRDISGWRHVLGLAQKLGADVSAFRAAEAAAEFGVLPPEESPYVPREPEPEADARSYRFKRGHNPYGNRRWLVHQALPETGVAFLAGQYGAGKTFAALDLAYSVMTGSQFAGMDTDRRGGVLYFAAEGEAEIPVRLEAIMQRHGDVSDTLPFAWRDDVPVMLERGSREKLVSIVRYEGARFKAEGIPLALIVIDTLAAAAGWQDENNAAEAQEAIRVMQALAKEAGALVLAVDHHGKDQAAGVRGSTAKAAGAEAVLSVLGDKAVGGETSNRRLALHKVRGGQSGREIPFDLPTVVAGEDAKGRPVTTCVIEWKVYAPQRETAAIPVPRGNTKAFYDVFTAEIDKAGGVTTTDDLCRACEGARVSDAQEQKGRTRAFKRARRDLIELGLIKEAAGMIWLADSAYDDFADIPL